MVIFIFVVFKVGGQYVFIDGGIILIEVFSYVVLDFLVDIVFCLFKYFDKVIEVCCQGLVIFSFNFFSDIWILGVVSRLNVDVQFEDGVYVIYILGMIGWLKGVDVIYYGVCNFLLVEFVKLEIIVGIKVV